MHRNRAHRILIVCPLQFERKMLLRAKVNLFADVACCGPGSSAIARWCEQARPEDRAVVLAGLAGGLHGLIRAGSAHFITEVVDGESGGIETPSLKPASIDPMRITSASASLTNPQAKQLMHERTSADLVDLESATFARNARQRGWSWGIVRGVSDDSKLTLPENIDQWVRPDGSTNAAVVFRTMLFKPAALGCALRLGNRSKSALHQVARLLKSSFCAEEADS